MEKLIYPEYQLKKSSRVRENIEWGTYYAFDALDKETPRVLLIGDSICYNYFPVVKERIEERATLTFWASSKCLTDPDYFRELEFILDASADYAFISFNNGLHSLYNTNDEEWNEAYCATVNMIRAKFPRANLALTLCTPLNDEGLNARSKTLNGYIRQHAEAFGLPTVDLYTPMEKIDMDADMLDPYHFKEGPIAIQGEIIADYIKTLIPVTKAVEHKASDLGPSGRIE